MPTPVPATPSRPEILGDAAIGLIAAEGLRALTHRAVDRAAGLPQGSTSYYAPTRVALLELVARRLAERSVADLRWLLERLGTATPADGPRAQVDQVADLLAAFTDRLAARAADMRARYALVIDSIDRDPLRGILTSRSPLLGETLDLAQRALARLGVPATPEQVQDLVILTDGVVFSMTVRAGGDTPRLDPRAIFATYLWGLRSADPAQAGRAPTATPA